MAIDPICRSGECVDCHDASEFCQTDSPRRRLSDPMPIWALSTAYEGVYALYLTRDGAQAALDEKRQEGFVGNSMFIEMWTVNP